jgi:hypothetical protein
MSKTSQYEQKINKKEEWKSKRTKIRISQENPQRYYDL